MLTYFEDWASSGQIPPDDRVALSVQLAGMTFVVFASSTATTRVDLRLNTITKNVSMWLLRIPGLNDLVIV